MVTKATPSGSDSRSSVALIIYKRNLKELQNGVVNRTISWRKKVLREFLGPVSDSVTVNSTLYTKCQEKTGLTVNSNFEIVPHVKGRRKRQAEATTTTEPAATTRSRPGTIKMKGPYPTELALVPKQGPASSKLPVPNTPPSAIVSSATGGSGSTRKSAKSKQIHADLIAACNSEIADAFNDIEELIDNVDRLGDAKSLKNFIRKTRAACKRLSDQLLAKTQIDKLQVNLVEP